MYGGVILSFLGNNGFHSALFYIILKSLLIIIKKISLVAQRLGVGLVRGGGVEGFIPEA